MGPCSTSIVTWLSSRSWRVRRACDCGPPVLAGELRPVEGRPINPAAREAPREAILTGVTAIDGLATLVRGQKLPVFSVGGLPHLELAAQVAAQAHVQDEPFAIVFAALGLPHADVQAVRSVLERRAVERIVTPRVALTVAEHLAFDLGRHVLVVLADLTNYCEAVRQVSAARGEIPSRRGYPGYLYSDLAALLERAGRIKGVNGSVTQLPVLTMPAGDITHPVPDVTGYITEGQIVLSPEAFARGVSPPFDPLASLSRLMRHGAGPALTRADHLEIAAQMYGIAARGRQAADLAEVVGEDALSDVDREYLRVLAASRPSFSLSR
jgi:V/A-type H+-transporting ATPase subunit B